MISEQFERWQDFSLRMAEHGYPKATVKRKMRIAKEVKSYFESQQDSEDWIQIKDWDGNYDDYYLGECVEEFFDEFRHWSYNDECYTGNFYNQITSCIRAGFDIAVEPSGGVVGFTVGDLKQMYGGVIPEWIKGQGWDVSLDEAADSVEIWL